MRLNSYIILSPNLRSGNQSETFVSHHICTPMMSCVSGSEQPSEGVHFVSFRSAPRLRAALIYLDCGTSPCRFRIFRIAVRPRTAFESLHPSQHHFHKQRHTSPFSPPITLLHTCNCNSSNCNTNTSVKDRHRLKRSQQHVHQFFQDSPQQFPRLSLS